MSSLITLSKFIRVLILCYFFGCQLPYKDVFLVFYLAVKRGYGMIFFFILAVYIIKTFTVKIIKINTIRSDNNWNLFIFMSVQTLPMGFAEQVLDLQIKLQDQQSLELIEILSKMYRIAVEYYINCEVSKANFFQRKLNNLAVKSLNCVSIESKALPRMRSKHQIEEEVHKYQMCQKTYIESMIKNSKKVQIKLKQQIQQNFKAQQQKFNGRLLRRLKSSKNL